MSRWRLAAAAFALATAVVTGASVPGHLVGVFADLVDPSRWNVLAIDPNTGTNTTLSTLASGGTPTFPAFSTFVPASNTLLVVTSVAVQGLDVTTGAQQWGFPFPMNSSDPLVGAMVVGSTPYILTEQTLYTVTTTGATAIARGLGLPSDALAAAGAGGTGGAGLIFVVDETSTSAYVLDLGANPIKPKLLKTGVNRPIVCQYSNPLSTLIELASYQLYFTNPSTGSSKKVMNIPDGPGYPRVTGLAPPSLGNYLFFFDFSNVYTIDLTSATIVTQQPFTLAPRAVGFPVWVAS